MAAARVYAGDMNSVIVHPVGIDAVNVTQDFCHIRASVKVTLGAASAVDTERGTDGEVGGSRGEGCSLNDERTESQKASKEVEKHGVCVY